jgi:hypothetical protein
VALSPSSGNLTPGQKLQLSATITGTSNEGLIWKVVGETEDISLVGNVSSTGLYTAPSDVPQGDTVTVTAVSAADGTTSGSAVFTISDNVVLSPHSVTIGVGEAFQFQASVNGSSTLAVLWKVNDIAGGNTTLGTITANGVYTAPTTIPPTAVTLSATYHNAASASASVTIFDPAVDKAHEEWLAGVSEAATTYGCTDVSVQQQPTEPLKDVITVFDLKASQGSCLVLWPVSSDPASLRYSFAWGGTVGGKDLFYISDTGQMRIWNGTPMSEGSTAATTEAASSGQ